MKKQYTINFSKKALDLIPRPKQPGARVNYYDSGEPGLVLRVSKTCQSFCYIGRIDGKSRRVLLGQYGPDPEHMTIEQARVKANRYRGAIRKGDLDVIRRDNLDPQSVEAVIEAYIARHLEPERGAHTDGIRLLRRNVVPYVKHRDIADLTRTDIKAWLQRVIDRKRKIAANRLLSAIKAWLRWAVQESYLTTSPADQLGYPTPEEQSRDRYLSDDELGKLLPVLETMGTEGKLIKLLLYLGQRRGEVAGMKWSQIDLAKGVWTLPAAATKSKKRIHDVPLCPAVVEILRSIPRSGDRVFPPYTGFQFQQIRKRIDKACPLDEPYTLHDLRATCASGMADIGVQPAVLSAILNHSIGKVPGASPLTTKVYIRINYAAQRREALTLWAEKLERIARGGADVIPFQTAQA